MDMGTAIGWLFATFAVGLLCLFAATPAYFVMFSRMFCILAERHSDVYRELGSPTLFLFRFQSFLLASEYQNLSDPALTRLGNIARIMLVIRFVILLGFVISYVVCGVFYVVFPGPRMRYAMGFGAASIDSFQP